MTAVSSRLKGFPPFPHPGSIWANLEVLFDVLSKGIVVLGEDLATHGTLLAVMGVHVIRHLLLTKVLHDTVADGADLL